MQYIDLSDSDKAVLDGWLALMRPLSGQIQRAVSGAVPIQDNWDAAVSAIIATLDAGAEIPNQTGLPASPVTKEDVEHSAASLSQLLAVLNTIEVRQRAIRLAGLANVAGG